MEKSKDLKYDLDIQLFAEGDGGEEGNLTPPTQPTAIPPIDYEKLAETISRRAASSEVSALKGILKEQGLTGDELNAAVKEYKESKQSKAKEEQERINKIIEENNKFKKEKLMENVMQEAKTLAKELNVREDRFDKLMNLCDKTKFTDDKGVIDKDAIKKELETQLKDVPEFKSTKQIIITKGKGSDTPPALTDDEEYRRKKYGKSKYFKG